MRNAFLVFVLFLAAALTVSAQTGTQAAPAAKPSTAAKPPVHHAAAGKPTAIIETSVGNLTCTLFPDKAPIGVENFIGLATGTKDWKSPNGTTKHGVPLYDGTIFHRVIPGFMIQGGDPAGTGSGPDPVDRFKNEVSSDVLFDRPGRLAYANAGPNTNSSQFFITEVATPHLNGNYTLFGQCDEATVALVKIIAHKATDPSNDRPFRPVKIVHIKIVRGGAPAAAKPATPAKKPASATPAAPSSPN
jgi:peptidyl-prolyl cis-trans isomerase A (cyclophilin A)